jgi:hypothetical protein
MDIRAYGNIFYRLVKWYDLTDTTRIDRQLVRGAFHYALAR